MPSQLSHPIDYCELEQKFWRDVAQSGDITTILQLLREYIDRAFLPSNLHVFRLNGLSGNYPADEELRFKFPDLKEFTSDSVLVRTLAGQNRAFSVAELSNMPEMTPDERAGIEIFDAELFLPIQATRQLTGWISMGSRRSGLPYTSQDLRCLESLSGEAALAAERLQKISELEAEVKELSFLQDLDRELNANLELERVMVTTLDWALRISFTHAGLIGVVKPEGFQVIVAVGYPQDHLKIGQWTSAPTPLSTIDLKLLRRAYETVTSQFHEVFTGEDKNDFSLLAGAICQFAVPISHEGHVAGLILLESRNPAISQDRLIESLSLLSEHAAFPITKAILYQAALDSKLARSQFVSFVAHELKNPMASIMGYIDLLSSRTAGPVTEMQSSFLAIVRSNVERMNTIVSDLNDLTKIQVGILRLDFCAVSLFEIVEDATRSLFHQMDEKRLILDVRIPPDLPAVWADPARLAQIVTNLLSNAQKYTPKNGQIVIGAGIYPEGENTSGGLKQVHFWVEDNGIGIPYQEQEKVFELYFRSEKAREMASGTGLGLAITHSLVEMQGGKIWFESRQGFGTTFHIAIPTTNLDLMNDTGKKDDKSQ